MSVWHTRTGRLRTTKLLSVTDVSPSVKTLTFLDKESARANPGQFVMLWIPKVDEIPLSVLDVEENRVSVAVKKVGEASAALQSKRTGDLIGIRGPFGNHFKIAGRRLLMVGGGTGVAPLSFLAKKFVPKESSVTFVLGAKTKDELLFMNDLESIGKKRVTVLTSTEDGTCGITGLCTRLVEDLLSKERFDSVYTCGPEKMILRVYELANKQRIPFQASLERMMRCAIGLCGSCVLGKYRVCRDGPVFNSRQLRAVRDEFGFLKRNRTGNKVPLD